MQIYGAKSEIKKLLYWVYKGMLADEDPLGCEPMCRLDEDDPNYQNCKHCIKESIAHSGFECISTLGIEHIFPKDKYPRDEKVNILDILNTFDNN